MKAHFVWLISPAPGNTADMFRCNAVKSSATSFWTCETRPMRPVDVKKTCSGSNNCASCASCALNPPGMNLVMVSPMW